jgi:hypothetical protein
MMTRFTCVLLFLLSVVALMSAVEPALAGNQAYATADSATVIVALVEELEGGSDVSAVLIRRAAARPTDVILLCRSDANGTRLASAVAMLMLQRGTVGPVPARDTKTILRGAAVPAARRANWLPRFESLVARLRRSGAREVQGVGRVPTEVLVLPPASLGARG